MNKHHKCTPFWSLWTNQIIRVLIGHDALDHPPTTVEQQKKRHSPEKQTERESYITLQSVRVKDNFCAPLHLFKKHQLCCNQS